MARVLVVEDEPNISAIILFKLRREGHIVAHVETGAAARDAGEKWDMVLLDSSLPGEDALELLAHFRGRFPVVVMTESLDEHTPAAAMAVGAVATVRKPFKPTVLARLVADVTRFPKGDAHHSVEATADQLITTVGAES
ncbi:MAG: response regulator [Candidatus Dormibacteria bacterium]